MDNRLRNTDKMLKAETLDDIARACGLSKTTISRAISGKGRISEATKERVKNYIQTHGYRPNSIARGLATSKTFNIGITMPEDTSREEIPFFQDCLVGITNTVAQSDYDTLLIVVSGKKTAELERIVQNHKVDGIILTRLYAADHEIQYLKKEKIPFVLIGTIKKDCIYQVDTNQQKGCYEIVEYLIKRGTNSFAVLAGNQNYVVDELRYAGFATACADNGIEIDQNLVFWNIMEGNEFKTIVKKILTRNIDCIICTDDVICKHLLSALDQLKIRIPDDVQVASFYDSPVLENHTPAITALHVDVRMLSSMAGNLLIDLIEGKNAAYRNYADYSIAFRNSTR
jgi:DNA-binding LacI/PurR family transcriptional regulator